MSTSYRGRIAPSPTGYLHLGHARTFWEAFQRARTAGGTLVFRNEDLDPYRSRREFATAMFEDLRWFGIDWEEGPDIGGPYAPYEQSRRRSFYLESWRELRKTGLIYPCSCSRRDLVQSAQAPHEALVHSPDDEPLYPGTCRGKTSSADNPAGMNWRFRVPDGRSLLSKMVILGGRNLLPAATSAISWCGAVMTYRPINWLWLSMMRR